MPGRWVVWLLSYSKRWCAVRNTIYRRSSRPGQLSQFQTWETCHHIIAGPAVLWAWEKTAWNETCQDWLACHFLQTIQWHFGHRVSNCITHLPSFRTMSLGNCRPHNYIDDTFQWKKTNKINIKMLKRRGPSMEPWGTPFVNTAHELLLFEILTRCFLPRK